MKYVIFTILILTIVSLFMNNTVTENFQSTSSSTVTTTSQFIIDSLKPVSDSLGSININSNLIDSNDPVSFDDLDVSSMSSGMYLVKVTVEGQSKTSKLIIR